MSKQGQDTIKQMITDLVVAELDAGQVPWDRGWVNGQLPTSMSTGKPYRGINVFLLNMRGMPSPYWGTFKAITDAGGQVRKGEHGTTVVFWKRVVKEDDTAPDGKRSFFLLRYYRVFNASQADGLPDKFFPKPPKMSDTERNARAETILADYFENGGPQVQHLSNLNSPAYIPALDVIQFPHDGQFTSATNMYRTKFHETVHSTGAASRLNRKGIAEYDYHGSDQYGDEELVAAMGQSMLLALCGLDPQVRNTTAYIKSWKKAIQSNPDMVIAAAGAAQKAMDFILDTQFEDTDD